MTSHDIPGNVRQLLRDCVDSYEQLEILTLFASGSPPFWTADAAAARSGVGEEAAAEALDCLARAGAVQRLEGPPAGRFALNPAWAAGVEELERVYRADRLGVMSLMTTNSLERLRTSAIRAFASSFLLGKKSDG